MVSLVVAASPCFSQTASSAPPKPPSVLNQDQLLRKYLLSTFGAPGALSATLTSGYRQWRHDPPEWGDNSEGFAKRWTSSFAQNAVGNTTNYAVARLLKQDPSFSRCQCKGFAPRLRHAPISPFTARTRSGRRVPSPEIVAGLAAEANWPAYNPALVRQTVSSMSRSPWR
jgi:hypothetical protein